MKDRGNIYISINNGIAVEVYRGCTGILHSFLTLALVVGDLSALRPGRFYPEEIPHVIRCVRGWVSHTICFTPWEKRKYLVPEMGIETLFFTCTVGSHYTN